MDFVIELETKMKAALCQNSTHCCDQTEMAHDVAKKLDLDWKAIERCMNNTDIGNEAEMVQENATNSLKPVLTSVPWITLQGEHTDDIQAECLDDTLKCVCNNVPKGSAKACK